jgi:hypothetical protein
MVKKHLLLAAVLGSISTSIANAGCLDVSKRTMPDGYVLTAAKCIGVMQQFNELQGNSEGAAGWASNRWIENAKGIDTACEYGDGSLSVADEASFAKTNLLGYFVQKNKPQVQAVMGGCDQLFTKAFE